MWETDSPRDECCVVPTSSKVRARAVEVEVGGQGGRSGAWGDFQGTQSRGHLSWTHRMSGRWKDKEEERSPWQQNVHEQRHGGVKVQVPLRRLGTWLCDVARRGGRERAPAKAERNARRRGLASIPWTSGAPERKRSVASY